MTATEAWTPHLVLGASSLLLALVWAIVADNGWQSLRRGDRSGAPQRLLPLFAGSLGVVYFTAAIFHVTPGPLHEWPPFWLTALYLLNDLCVCLAVAFFRHLTRYFSLRDEPPRRTWLVVNYGTAAAMIALVFAVNVHGDAIHPVLSRPLLQLVLGTYVATMIGLTIHRLIPLAQGGWRPGGLPVVRRPDILLLTGGLCLLLVTLALHALGSWADFRYPLSLLTTLFGFVIVVPFAIRILGEVLRGVLLFLGMLVPISSVVAGAIALDARLEPALETRPLVVLLAVAALAAVVGPWQEWLRPTVDRLVFRRGQHRRSELQQALHALSPELGMAECCRRALEELRRVMQLRSAAILLRDGGSVAAGDIPLARLDLVWPRGAEVDGLRGRPLDYAQIRALPFAAREALHAAAVIAVLDVSGPKRLWGHLLITTHFVSTTFSDEDARALDAFTDQLALLLDATDLLTRVVAVERSLAHAEKLAAIGELAARVAHEIRNPVTAARSLAQLLAREPTSPLNAEHAGLILAELERVERQVADLLRFARRDELCLEPIDLGELARETLGQFQLRIDSSGVAVDLTAPPGVVARADREKMRQVLINLVENALDALAESDGERRLSLEVGAANGLAAVRVVDTGPGVEPSVLPRLFDPFFSLKPHGTGLGLAIVKRTVEAHGGSVAVAPADGGLAFRVELPLAGPGETEWSPRGVLRN